MKENYLPALKDVLAEEGGFSNRILDMGGPTDEGITLNTIKEFWKDYHYGDFDGDGDIDINDIKLLNTPEKADPIYRKLFWDKMNLDNFPAGVDFLMFEFGVNSGPGNAVKILQRALNRTGANLDADGCAGPRTMQKVTETDPIRLGTYMILERQDFYKAIVQSHPDQMANWHGWINRLNHISLEVRNFYAGKGKC